MEYLDGRCLLRSRAKMQQEQVKSILCLSEINQNSCNPVKQSHKISHNEIIYEGLKFFRNWYQRHETDLYISDAFFRFPRFRGFPLNISLGK